MKLLMPIGRLEAIWAWTDVMTFCMDRQWLQGWGVWRFRSATSCFNPAAANSAPYLSISSFWRWQV